jgi:hypothetical protein
MNLLAQLAWRGWGFGELAILVIIIAAVVAVVFIGTKAMGVAIPQWVISVFWVLVIAFVCIVAIRLLMSM